MSHWFPGLFTALVCVSTLAAEPGQADQASKTAPKPAAISLEKIDRILTKEPKYLAKPKYSLLVLGTAGKVKVWMVEDGKRLFVDKNANGDLTDDGPPLKPKEERKLGPGSWDFNYMLETIAPADGSRHTSFRLRRWNYGDDEDSYGLSLTLDDHIPMYAGWFGTFWSAKAETAPVVHFGGPLTPKLLRAKEFIIGGPKTRLSVAFVNPGLEPGAMSRLSIEALAPLIRPKVEIQWPADPGREPLTTTHVLDERCCYWEFYTTNFQSPADILPGVAKLTLRLPAGAFPFELTTSTIEVPVVRPAKP
jgi:hypothetical protein